MEAAGRNAQGAPANGAVAMAQCGRLALVKPLRENVEEYVRKAAALANEPQKLAWPGPGLPPKRMRQSKLMGYEGFGRDWRII